jgi:hypothetical protein
VEQQQVLGLRRRRICVKNKLRHETLVCSAHISLSFHSAHTPSSFHLDVALHPLRINYSVDDGVPQAPPAVVKTRMVCVHTAPLGDKDGGGERTPMS